MSAPEASSGRIVHETERLKMELDAADSVVIGAGSGLSTAAGYAYSGPRFDAYFSDFRDRYGITDMYSGGFYPFEKPEIFWAWWSRQIWLNRFMPIPNDVYDRLYTLIREKDYFVITTNVDHCFQRSGFDKRRLYYTQGDYGLFQSSLPSGRSAGKTYENETAIREMVLAQGFSIAADGSLTLPDDRAIRMEIPADLVPICPDDGRMMTTNLRVDARFVQDAGWYAASRRYELFLEKRRMARTLYWELGIGYNTPGIIKYAFWRRTAANPNAVYCCLNLGEASAPEEIAPRSICIDRDIREVLGTLTDKV